MHAPNPTTFPDRSPQLLATLEQLLGIEAASVEDALTQTSNRLAAALQCDKIDVMLLDAPTRTLVAVGVSDTPMGRHQRALGLDRQQLANGGRAAFVFAGGDAYHDGDVGNDPGELVGIREGMGVQSQIIVPLDGGGERRGVLAAASARRDAFTEADLRFLGAVSGWVGTVLVRAELQERLAREAAERARQATADEMIVALAHDLRTPLTPVLSYLSIINESARRDGRGREAEYAGRGLRAARRLNGMIGDLLDAERLDRGIFALSPTACDLVALVREAVAILDTAAVPIAVVAPDALVLAVDPARVRQALENLVGNAQRYAPKGSAIAVRIATEERDRQEWAVLSVHDEGPGIAAERRATLFERLRTAPDSAGLGLGLYLVRGIMDAHRGAVAVDSVPGAGTTFRLLFPRHPREDDERAEARARGGMTHPDGR